MSTTFTVDPIYGLLTWPVPTPPQTSFGYIRDALSAVRSRVGTHYVLDLGLTASPTSFDIREFSTPTYQTVNKKRVQNGWTLATNGPNTLARFGAGKSVVFQGKTVGNVLGATPTTTITGNARIYAGQSDRSSGVPTEMTLNNINLPYIGASGYILQSGDRVYGVSGLTAINSRIVTVSLDNVVFSGSHSGAVGSGGGAPFGNYMDVAVVTSLTFKKINVALTGQGGGNFFATNPTTYGSAFLLANGPQITVTDSTFDEAGYRNALALWGAENFETNVTIFKNTFTRTANQDIRTAGETLSRVKGSVTENTFEQGAYLDLQNLDLPSSSSPLAISGGNTFSLLQGGYGIIVRNDQTAANLAKLVIQGNSFDGGLAVLNQISADGSVLSFGTNDVNQETFDTLKVGGTGADTVTGTSGIDWISGGGGIDTLTGGADFDAFVFASTLNAATNLATITDFKDPDPLLSQVNPNSDQIWLDNFVFTGLAAGVLNASDFGTAAAIGTDVVYDATTKGLYFAADGAATLASYTQFATLGGTSTTTLSNADFFVF